MNFFQDVGAMQSYQKEIANRIKELDGVKDNITEALKNVAGEITGTTSVEEVINTFNFNFISLIGNVTQFLYQLSAYLDTKIQAMDTAATTASNEVTSAAEALSGIKVEF